MKNSLIAASVAVFCLMLSACIPVEPTVYDDSRSYYLPYKESKAHFVTQGYNGSFSHQGQFALDFVMPEGTAIHASREGTVYDVIEEYEGNCEIKEECYSNYNYITIEHIDGSLSHYGHIKKDGACVYPGQYIERGDIIGYSGNVGFSTGPHLHFEIVSSTNDVATFADVDENGSGIPVESMFYISANKPGYNFCYDS